MAGDPATRIWTLKCGLDETEWRGAIETGSDGLKYGQHRPATEILDTTGTELGPRSRKQPGLGKGCESGPPRGAADGVDAVPGSRMWLGPAHTRARETGCLGARGRRQPSDDRSSRGERPRGRSPR